MKHRSKRFLSILLSLALVLGMFPGMSLTAYAATSHGITINTAQHGTVTASVNGSAATSAEEGATVTLTANPDNGYRLKSISGVYKDYYNESMGIGDSTTGSSANFSFSAEQCNYNGCRLYQGKKITISSSTKTITRVVFTVSGNGNSRNESQLVTSSGTKTVSGTGAGSTITISNLSTNSVSLTGNGSNNAQQWQCNRVVVYGQDISDTTLKVNNTSDPNIRTFTMPAVVQGNVTITAEFEEMPKYKVTLTGGANATTSGGNTTQTELTGAMETVTYTANSGFHFTEFANITNNGITATRTSDTAVTVSGTPTADASITIPDAMKQVQTITASDVTATYGDTDKSVSASVTNPATGGGAISYAVKDGSADYIDVDATTGALNIKKVPADGKAYVVVTAAGTAAYEQATKDVTVTINKANSTVTKAPEAKTLTYNGSAQELVTAGTATGGEMQYALGNETEATEPYTTSIPSKTNAGTYYVWYKVVGDANHNSTEPNSVEAKINPVDKTDLNTAIEEAEAYYESIKEDDVYAQVAEALKKAIDEAKKYTNDNVAEKEVKEAIDTIKAAKVDAEEGKKEADDTEAAKKVTDAINALSASDKVATTDKAAIEAARKAYDALTADQKKKVSADTLKKLEAAEKALATAEKKETDDTDAAKKVTDAINALSASDKVATTDKAAIEAARKAYDALTADQKKLVDAATLKKLTDTEKALTTAEANDKVAKELEAAKQEAQAAMNEQVTVTQKGNKFTVKWKKASSADGYYVYALYCGKKATKPVKTIKKNSTTKTTITKIDGKKINQKKNFRVYVAPYKIVDGKKVTLGKSMTAHLVGSKNTKYSNVKKLTLTKSKYTVKVGKTAKIKAKVTLVNKNKKHIPKSHGAKFRYKSSDTSIANVDKNGKIKGIKKGTCTIYVYSINGLMKKAKVTVK